MFLNSINKYNIILSWNNTYYYKMLLLVSFGCHIYQLLVKRFKIKISPFKKLKRESRFKGTCLNINLLSKNVAKRAINDGFQHPPKRRERTSLLPPPYENGNLLPRYCCDVSLKKIFNFFKGTCIMDWNYALKTASFFTKRNYIFKFNLKIQDEMQCRISVTYYIILFQLHYRLF